MISGETTVFSASGRRGREPAVFPLADADRCVLCGLCLPHCPTYRLTRDENESPRGRISLMRAVATGGLPLDRTVIGHLSHCLACRACERVCPSGVPYGRLIEAGRAMATRSFNPGLRARLGLAVVAYMPLLKSVATLLRRYQRLGLRRLLRASGILRIAGVDRLDRRLPRLPAACHWKESYPAHGQRRGRVALFVGCVASVTDTDTIAAAIRLLNRLGFEVRVPPDQGCCGGLHREAGDLNGAHRLQARNAAAFAPVSPDPVITLASGCGAVLRAAPDSTAGATGFAQRVQDINVFVAGLELPPGLRLAPLPETAAVHDPCSLRNGLRGEQAVYRLLGRIPQLRVEPLPENAVCCGGAGGYVLREPEFADRLRAPKLEHIVRLRPDRVVSANLGCAQHLAAGLRARGIDLPVVHPLVLFERQLQLEASSP